MQRDARKVACPCCNGGLARVLAAVTMMWAAPAPQFVDPSGFFFRPRSHERLLAPCRRLWAHGLEGWRLPLQPRFPRILWFRHPFWPHTHHSHSPFRAPRFCSLTSRSASRLHRCLRHHARRHAQLHFVRGGAASGDVHRPASPRFASRAGGWAGHMACARRFSLQSGDDGAGEWPRCRTT